MPGGVARARLFHSAPSAHTKRVLLHKFGELISYAAKRSDAASTAERARGGKATLHGGPNELALVRHRIEKSGQFRFNFERNDVFGRSRFSRHNALLAVKRKYYTPYRCRQAIILPHKIA